VDMATRKAYPSDVSEEEWAFVAPYLARVREDAPQRQSTICARSSTCCEVGRAYRLLEWRYMPHDLWPWEALYQQTQRWIRAGVFEELVNDLCAYCCGFRRRGLRSRAQPYSTLARCAPLPRAALGAATLLAQGQEGLKSACAAVDTLGHLLALLVSPANEDDRKEVGKLSEEIQQATQENVELAYVDQGYTGERAAEAAHSRGISLEVVKHQEAKGGFVLLPRRWVVERDFVWASRFLDDW
jgi:transposase